MERPDRPPPQKGVPPPPVLKVSAKEWTPGASAGGGAKQIDLSAPAKQVVLGGAPAKQIDLSGPAKQVVLGGGAKQIDLSGPAKQVVLGAAPAKQIDLSGPAKQIDLSAKPAAAAAVPEVSSDFAKLQVNDSKPAAPAAEAWEESTTKPVAEKPKEEKPKEEKPKPAPAPAAKPAAAAPAKAAAAKDEAPEDLGEVKEADVREHLNCVFIGHVDAGKSTLCGSILLHTGVIDKRTVEKYEKEAKQLNRESWFLAFIMDTNEEERVRGKTVEVGRESFATEKKRFTILDAPGHKNYVPAMIAGASHADVGILVISASKGEFESGFEKGGQTREHAMLAFTLGIRKLIVAVNKMDDNKFDRTRFTEIETKLTPYLKACGFKVKKDVIFMPLAALLGAGVLRRVTKEECSWIEEVNGGRSLIETLEEVTIEDRNSEGPLRMSIMDAYNDRGIWAMGKIESGTLKRGSQVIVSPTGIKTSAAAILIDGANVASAKTGENVIVKIQGGDVMSEADVQKGFVLCDEKFQCKTFTATIRIIELLEHRSVFTAGYTAVLHAHTIACEAIVAKIMYKHDPETGKPIKEKCNYAKVGDIITVRIEVPQSIAVEPFDIRPQLGRVTLRDEGKTIAIGKIKRVGDEPAKKEG